MIRSSLVAESCTPFAPAITPTVLYDVPFYVTGGDDVLERYNDDTGNSFRALRFTHPSFYHRHWNLSGVSRGLVQSMRSQKT